MSDIVFISDLHLAPERPEIIRLFSNFVDEIAAQADTLYILGDFLEYWLGDDDPAPALAPVFNKLIELHEKYTTRVFFMHGNRDFLIGNRLAERCHFTLIDEPYSLKLQGKNALLMHGDTLCTDDVDYQKLRRMVRNPAWQQQVLAKSLKERIQLAKELREISQQSTTAKAEYIMDVNQQATDRVFIENDIDLLIHGHTHRPAVHHKLINNHETTRVVLGDWYKAGSYLRVKDTSDLVLQTYQ
ncbi:MAG: UDP-2,3-diacylglucosamine diphosphatase [Gammaproteobacteria bacterium]|nr:UDP-2,3-diacylglucosamine diphosphatase [Gammaproteobacteria bacterium]